MTAPTPPVLPLHDPVDRPAHYLGRGGLTHFAVVEAYGLERDHYLGCALKYLLRAGRKGDPAVSLAEDLGKAAAFLDRKILRDGTALPWERRRIPPELQPLAVMEAFGVHALACPALGLLLEALITGAGWRLRDAKAAVEEARDTLAAKPALATAATTADLVALLRGAP